VTVTRKVILVETNLHMWMQQYCATFQLFVIGIFILIIFGNFYLLYLLCLKTSQISLRIRYFHIST